MRRSTTLEPNKSLDCLGVSFAPRIKNLKKQNLNMFRSRRGWRPGRLGDKA